MENNQTQLYREISEQDTEQFEPGSLWQLNEADIINRLSACAAQHGVTLSEDRLATLLLAEERKPEPGSSFEDAAFFEKGLIVEQTQPGWTYGSELKGQTVGRVHFLPNNQRQPQADKTSLFGSDLLRAAQDYVILAEAGGIQNVPDVMVGVALNDSILRVAKRRFGMHDFDYAPRGLIGSFKEFSEKIFSADIVRLQDRLASRLGEA